MITILQKELQSFFSSFIAYLIIGFFITLMGLLVWVFPGTNLLDSGYADLSALFRLAPYVLMFLAPAITMGLLSEEFKTGTWELLITSPITKLQIVLGKYLASLIIIISILLLTIIYVISIYYLASPVGNIDIAALIGSYIGLFLLSAVFLAVGLGASAFTQSQVIAFIVSTFFCFVLYQGFDAWTILKSWESYSLYIAKLGIIYHYEALSRGVIDLSDVAYFCSLNVLLLAITNLVLSKR